MSNTAHNSSTKTLVKDTTVYGIGTLVNQLIPFLLLPVLTRYLRPNEYGIVAMFSVTVAIFVNIVGLNLQSSIQRLYVDLPNKQLSRYVGTAVFITGISLVFFLGVAINFKEALCILIGIPSSWIPFIAIVSFFQAVISILQVLWRMEEKAKQFVVFQCLLTAANLGLSLVFVVWFLWHWQGRLLGILCSYVIFGVISILLLNSKGYLKLQFNKQRAKYMLLYSIPLIPHALSTWVMNGSDRIFLINMVGASAVGLYSVGYAFGQIIQLLQHAFSQAWVPFLYRELKKDQEEIRIRIVKYIYLHHAAIIIVAFLIYFATPLVLKIIVGKSFQGASHFVLWVAIGYALNGMYRMVIPFLNYAQKTKYAPIGSCVAAIANLVLNYLLIRINGPVGAAQATLISFFILYVITFYFSQKAYKMPWLFWLSMRNY